MLRRLGLGGIGGRVAMAALAAVLIAVVIIAMGVTVVGGDLFVQLMMLQGAAANQARAMFDESVNRVVFVAVAVAVIAATFVAVVLGRRLSRPLQRLDDAARRISTGDYGARVPSGGPAELASLADSFNRMAESLAEQERLRRDFVANAAHELRTPLTNLKGYLEGLRDGVIPPERETFESLWEEAERLVRLSRSLDTLAEGDAADGAGELVSVVNSGAVIPADDLERVFERFYRVEKSRDTARGGAGIGLAIVKQLVEAGDGRVGADSGEGQTRFWFSLPA